MKNESRATLQYGINESSACLRTRSSESCSALSAISLTSSAIQPVSSEIPCLSSISGSSRASCSSSDTWRKFFRRRTRIIWSRRIYRPTLVTKSTLDRFCIQRVASIIGYIVLYSLRSNQPKYEFSILWQSILWRQVFVVDPTHQFYPGAARVSPHRALTCLYLRATRARPHQTFHTARHA